MSELDEKIEYLLKQTGDNSFDVGMFLNPFSEREEFIIGEYCTLHKDDEILTAGGRVVKIISVDSCDVDSNWFNWLRSIFSDACFHLAKARVTYRTLIDWDN